MSKVLIGITTKNRAVILPKAITSALNLQYLNKEVTVFDDNSSDNTNSIRKLFPNVSWYFSNEERGLVYARNRFINTTDAKYYCSLDDDAWFLDTYELSNAINYMNNNTNVAVLAFKILSDDLRKENKRGDSIIETNNFIGCGHMLRIDAVREVGSYAENPGFYGSEEKDLCIRLIDKGYSIMRFPSVMVWHDKTLIARDFTKQHRSGVCNDLVFMWRRTPVLFLFPSFLMKIYKHFIFSIRYKEAKLILPYFYGIKDFMCAILNGKVTRKAVSLKGFKKYLSFNK